MLSKDGRAGLRVKVADQDKHLTVQVRDSDDVSYRDCLSLVLSQGTFKPFITLASSNHNEWLNDIDLDAVYLRNTDPDAYQDKEGLENIRLNLLAEKYEISNKDSGNLQA